MLEHLKGRRGGGMTEYIVILALILGMILIIFGRSLWDTLLGQMDVISSGVELTEKKKDKEKKKPGSGETTPKKKYQWGWGNDDTSSSGGGTVPAESSGPVRFP